MGNPLDISSLMAILQQRLRPATYVDQSQEPRQMAPMDVSAPPPAQPGLLDRLFMPSAGVGDLTDEERRMTRHAGLIQAGLRLLQPRQPGESGGLLPALGRSLEAGQTGAMANLQNNDALNERASARQGQAIMQQLNIEPTPEGIQRGILQLVRAGRPREAQSLVGVLNAIRPTESSMPYTGLPDGAGILNRLTGQVSPLGRGEGATMPIRMQTAALETARAFRTRMAPLESAANQYQGMRRLIAQMRANPEEVGPQAIGLLYQYAKQLDPGSAVREGELDIQNRAGSILTRMTNALEGLRSGGRATVYLKALEDAAAALNDVNRETYQRAAARESSTFHGVTGYDLPLGESLFYTPPERAPRRPGRSGIRDLP